MEFKSEGSILCQKMKLPLILTRITVGELAAQNKDKEGLKWVLIPAKKRQK